MLRECINCKHCNQVIEHYENIPEFFGWSLEFYCLKYGKHLGNMIKKKTKVEYLPCFEKRKEEISMEIKRGF